MALTKTVSQIRPLQGAIVKQYEAGGAGNIGDWVYVDANDDVQAAQADDAGTVEALGLVVSVSGQAVNPRTTFASGDTVGVVVFGPVTGFSGMTQNGDVYVDAAAAGGSTQTAPGVGNFVKVAGRATTSSELFVNALMTPAAVAGS